MSKKLLAAILIGALCLAMPGMQVSATDAGEAAPAEATEEVVVTDEEQAAQEQAAAWQAEYDKAPDTNAIENWPAGPNVWGKGAVVMDMNSGAVLYGKDMEGKYYPASITKLLTALVALENEDITDKVVGTDACYEGMDWTFASIALKTGEELPLEEALYALLFSSANEVAHAIAESSPGGYDDFIAKMNERATELGCVNSNFVNPNGLDDENHYTCAYDMALIGSAVYQQEEFRKIESDLYHTIPKTNMSDERQWITQNHKMLFPENAHYYPYTKAGKTGYTDMTKSTLVTMADNGTLQLVAVDLCNEKAAVYEDTTAMFEYGFNNFQKLALKDNETTDKIESFENEDAYVVVPNNVTFAELENEIIVNEDSKKKEGVIAYTYHGQPVGHANIILSDEYYKEVTGVEDLSFLEPEEKEDPGFVMPLWMKIVIGVVALLIILFVIIVILVQRRRRKLREERRRRREEFRRKQQNQRKRRERNE